jgi:heptosyltransferase II
MPRLLLIKLGAIGDVVMAIPASHAMHQAGFQVDWVCGYAVAPILQLYPWINAIPFDESLLHSGPLPSRIAAAFALWRRLPALRYDVCATLYYDRRYRLLTLPVRARRTLLLSPDHRSLRLLPGRHHTDEYARILLSQLPGAPPDGENPAQLSPVPADGLPLCPIPSQPGRLRLVLFPAGARNDLRDDPLRRWPLDLYVQLAATLLDRGNEVILSGAPGDLWASPAFSHLSVTDLTGQLSLLQTLALLDSSDLTVTHDTGPLHLAGLTSTAIVTIFGPTDPRGRLPQRSNCTALWGGEGFACRPCYDGRDFAPCSHNGCMHQVTPALVLAEIDRLLEARRGGLPLPPRVVVPEHSPLLQIAAGVPEP